MSVTWAGSYNSHGWTHLRLAMGTVIRRPFLQREGATSVGAPSRIGVARGRRSSGPARPLALAPLIGSTRSCVATAAGEGPSYRAYLAGLDRLHGSRSAPAAPLATPQGRA